MRIPKRCWNLAASPSPGLPLLDRIRHLRYPKRVMHGRCIAVTRILIRDSFTCDPRCVYVVRNCDPPLFRDGPLTHTNRDYIILISRISVRDALLNRFTPDPNPNLHDCVTHNLEERDVGQAWLQRFGDADILRAGPTRAVGQGCVRVAGSADPDRVGDWDSRISSGHVSDPFQGRD